MTMKMSKSTKQNYVTPSTTEISPLQSLTSFQTSEIPVKTSILQQARTSWLTIVLVLVAVAGISAAIGVSIVAFVVLPRTTVKCE